MACFPFSNQLGRTFVLRRGGVKNNMPCAAVSSTNIIIILQHFLSRQQLPSSALLRLLVFIVCLARLGFPYLVTI